MACFLVSVAEAAVVKAMEKAEEKKEQHISKGEVRQEEVTHIPLSRKLKWLSWLLTGGAVLLAFEHIWHGEVVPWFPFLSAMGNSADTAQMLHEMATTGVCMAVLVTLVWAIMCIAADAIVKRPETDSEQKTAA